MFSVEGACGLTSHDWHRAIGFIYHDWHRANARQAADGKQAGGRSQDGRQQTHLLH